MKGLLTLPIHREPKIDHVAILRDILLAFQAPFAGILGALLAVARNEILIGDDFSADETTLEVGMNDARCLRRQKRRCAQSRHGIPEGSW